MFLSRFGVKNYKCLGEIDIPLTPVHVLIGPNDSGKTSLLEAMAAFHGSAEHVLPEVFPKPWSGRDLVRHGADARQRWTSAASGPPIAERRHTKPRTSPIGLSVDGFRMEGQTCVADSEVLRLDAEEAQSPQKWASESLLHAGRKNPTARGGFSAKHLNASGEDCETGPEVLAGCERSWRIPAAIDPARKFRLDPDGFGLATLLDDILGYDPERFIGLRTDFCRFFPQFQSVRIETENALRRHYAEDGRHQSERRNRARGSVSRLAWRLASAQASVGWRNSFPGLSWHWPMSRHHRRFC